MKDTRKQKTEPDQLDKRVMLLRKCRTRQYDAGLLGASYEAGEIGRDMARKVAKKLRLKLDV